MMNATKSIIDVSLTAFSMPAMAKNERKRQLE
jgi:hypothetical protein